MIDFSHIVYEIIVWLFLIYSALIFIIYSWIGFYAFGALKGYLNLNQYTNYNLIATNPNAPSFSIIAPAYNEGMTIVENVRSLLSLYYNNLEIIIVNDGSGDDSIDKLIKAYNLELVPYHVQEVIPTKAIRGIYKSKNKAFKKLIVIDKVNGGKADALNVGINVSKGKYIVCIDVDCILEQDAILKLSKPFLDQTDKRVIACGGVIRLANNCKIQDGKVVDVSLPKSWLGRFQALEYIRAFVLGRMAWSRASGLILISGAFGAFDKEIVLACGGYDPKTVGEDMELVVRMRRYMEENKKPYKVVNISNPLCWTEVPESGEILKRQRNRWMRGTMETLWTHRKLLFNPKYGKLGMISIPYWFFFEFLGPIVEFIGYCVFILFLLLGIIDWPFFFALFILVVSSGILYSIYAILVDLMTHRVYTRGKDLVTLILTAILEPFFYHGKTVMAGVSGVRAYFQKQHSWGVMTRQGFQQGGKEVGFWQNIYNFITWGLRNYAPIAFVFMLLYMGSVGMEAFWYDVRFNDQIYTAVYFNLFMDNLVFVVELLAGCGIVYLLLLWLTESWTNIVVITLFTLIIVLQIVFFLYFAESQNLLGADFFFYSYDELKHILKTSGMLNIKNIALFVLSIIGVSIPLWFVTRVKFKGIYAGAIIIILGLLFLIVPVQHVFRSADKDEFTHNASLSKWRYFMQTNFNSYLSTHPQITRYWSNNQLLSAANLSPYPFLRAEKTEDFLGKYMQKSEQVPNIVILIIEGLGHAYSSTDGYIGNFTPFLDSLSKESLFWSNALSSSGRTFSVIPTIVGSLPFASNGFLEQDTYPKHYNLFNVLKKNGFQTGFFYGGDASFDNMKRYLQANNLDVLVEESSFESSYKKLPSPKNGESWGYEDQAVFSKMLHSVSDMKKPHLSMVLTLSTHSPFLLNNQSYFDKLVQKRIVELQKSDAERDVLEGYSDQLASIMNVDLALKEFFADYKKRPDYENTIFIITGDHSMPEIALENKIDRYHVPLLIFSPLLKSSATFKNIVSHFDIAPTVLAYYKNNYNLHTPDQVTWIGKGLRTDAIATLEGIPIMQSKYQLEDYIYTNYHIAGNQLFKLTPNLLEDEESNSTVGSVVKSHFELFKEKNKKFVATKKLMPDSLYTDFFSRK